MVYIAKWAEYQSAAEALYEKAPDRARYCVKWKPREGKLVLKITDDVTCLKYKTQSSIYLNRFEALNLSLMQKMQNVQARATSPGGAGEGEKEGSRAGTPAPGPGSASVPAIGGSTVAAGGVKKKKGKKRK